MAQDPYLPGFKTICTVVGITYVLLGSSMLLRGAHASMAPFAVPEATLSSPHFADFFHFVFVHMVVIGVLIGMLGRLVEKGGAQRFVARALTVIQIHYAYLDFRTSDSVLGSGLYRGPASLGPAIVGVLVTLAFAYLSVRPLRSVVSTRPS